MVGMCKNNSFVLSVDSCQPRGEAQVLRDPAITLTSQLYDWGGKPPKASVSRDTPLEAQLCIPDFEVLGEINAQRLIQGNPSHWQVTVSMNSAGNGLCRDSQSYCTSSWCPNEETHLNFKPRIWTVNYHVANIPWGIPFQLRPVVSPTYHTWLCHVEQSSCIPNTFLPPGWS